MEEITINYKWKLKVPEIRVKALPWSIWEQERLDAMHKVIRKTDTILDIGAEFGDMSALYAMWGKDIILVEPSDCYWVYIKEIFEANGLKEPVGSCVDFVGSKDQKPLFEVYYPEETTFDKKIEGDQGFGFQHLNEQLQANIITIDTISEFQKPDIINIDIEGAEYQALLGAKKTINRIRPIWFISVHPEFMYDRYKNTSDDLVHMMELAGYTTIYLGQDHEKHFMFKP